MIRSQHQNRKPFAPNFLKVPTRRHRCNKAPSSASYRPRLQSEANGDDPTNHDSVMTDFDRTSNSETANILSTSCDKLLMTHEEFTLAAIEDTPDLALRMAASYLSGEGRLVCFFDRRRIRS
jgi:hypothetical protein